MTMFEFDFRLFLITCNYNWVRVFNATFDVILTHFFFTNSWAMRVCNHTLSHQWWHFLMLSPILWFIFMSFFATLCLISNPSLLSPPIDITKNHSICFCSDLNLNLRFDVLLRSIQCLVVGFDNISLLWFHTYYMEGQWELDTILLLVILLTNVSSWAHSIQIFWYFIWVI